MNFLANTIRYRPISRSSQSTSNYTPGKHTKMTTNKAKKVNDNIKKVSEAPRSHAVSEVAEPQEVESLSTQENRIA